jgi:hypothetical protein
METEDGTVSTLVNGNRDGKKLEEPRCDRNADPETPAPARQLGGAIPGEDRHAQLRQRAVPTGCTERKPSNRYMLESSGTGLATPGPRETG